MRTGTPLLFLALVAVTWAGCSRSPAVTLINGTDAEVVLRVADEGRTGDPLVDRVVRLAPGGANTFLVGKAAVRGVRLSSAKCDYRFDLPAIDPVGWTAEELEKDPTTRGYSFPVKMQVEPDFVIYLVLVRGKPPIPLARLLEKQGHGFPLRPTTKKCR